MRHSLASCLTETAHRLIATRSTNDDAEARRTVGRALLSAEVLGMRRQPVRSHGTQGIELLLGVYDRTTRDKIDEHAPLIANEFSATLGGYTGACVVATQRIDSHATGWMNARFRIAAAAQPRHLHELMLEQRAEPFKGNLYATGSANGKRLRDSCLLIVMRRLRWRISVDHGDKDSPPNILYWTTPTTDEWINRLGDKDWSKLIALLGPKLLDTDRCRADAAPNNPDNWGDLTLEDDPITVLTLGPHTSTASTHRDVASTLERALPQLKVVKQRLPSAESTHPVADYALALQELADNDPLERCDVVLAYRGGGLVPAANVRAPARKERLISDEDKEQLLQAATALAEHGVEVVIGIGHGDLSVFPAHARVPIGVFEAVTPTAAAEWVLREHVNTRLAGSGSGQPREQR
jgi:hypothetical protein